ncbi:bile acid:sodium symporter family protein [Massilia sp.]|uniref:bile acid:sodium symporter family protein n=1 Tax=Massilia sp. TaxID=1882437 RepID=UPI00289C80AB|nr:bile acid:sodium symporter family protein [Massilia sp.]
MQRPRYLPDNFTLSLLATVALASLLPCSGVWGDIFGVLTKVAVGAMFFLHGVRLSGDAVRQGALHWRLHACVLATTFVLYPLLGLALGPIAGLVTTPELYLGILFLCALPSTIQSSIALTSLARGNVPAAVCSASASTMIGIFVTPLIAGMLMATHGSPAAALSSIGPVVAQLLLPFIAGQVARRWIGAWVGRHKPMLSHIDRGTVLLVVYTAFSASVIQGLWQRLPLPALAGLVALIALLLALAIVLARLGARWLGLGTTDEVTIVFCGAQKSLASGVPMAQVLFAADLVGAVVLPVMLYHPMQLMVCAAIAQRYARCDGGAAKAVVPKRV